MGIAPIHECASPKTNQGAKDNDVRDRSSSPAEAVRTVQVSGPIGSPERQHLTDRYHHQQSQHYDERNSQLEAVEENTIEPQSLGGVGR